MFVFAKLQILLFENYHIYSKAVSDAFVLDRRKFVFIINTVVLLHFKKKNEEMKQL